MTDNKKTLKERREESDENIIKSAIKCFGKDGYTNASLKKIATGAGVTGGLITQRYGTKENLFRIVYIRVMSTAFYDEKGNLTPKEVLISIIQQIKIMCEKYPDEFDFCCMAHSSTDYPKEMLKDFIADQKKSNLYLILKRAQECGSLPLGNIDVLLATFCGSVFLHVSLCKKYMIEPLDDEFYLLSIGYTDKHCQ